MNIQTIENIEVLGVIVPIVSEESSFMYSIHPKWDARWVECHIEAISDKPMLSIDFAMPQEPQTLYLQVRSVNFQPPFMHKEFMGYRLDEGSLSIRGVLLDERPDDVILLADFAAPFNAEPMTIDHTRGRGTYYEIIARTHDNE